MQSKHPKAGAQEQETFAGLDGLRWFAAWAVVFSHSFLIAMGSDQLDPLAQVLGPGNSFGLYAVRTFFALSGVLLMRSLVFSADPLRFLANRLLRLVPGFAFAIAVTVLVIGIFLTPLKPMELWFSGEAWRSIYWSVTCLNDLSSLPAGASRYPDLAGFLNGALWTIPYELVCYLLILSLFMLLRRPQLVIAASVILGLCSFLGAEMGWTTMNWAHPNGAMPIPLMMMHKTMPYFCAGIVFFGVHQRWPYHPKIAGAALLLFLVALATGYDRQAFIICGPPMILWLCRWRGLSWSTHWCGEISYGIYLFGWPVSLAIALHTTNPYLVFFGAAPFILGLALLMRHLVEEPVNRHVKPALMRVLPKLPRPEMASASWWHMVAYWGFFIAITRFLFFPLPGSANWFGYQIHQLGLICAGAAVLVYLGNRRAAPPAQTTAPAVVQSKSA